MRLESARGNSSYVVVAWIALLGTCVAPAHARSGDWPQWRGPLRTGEAPDFEPPAAWPAALRLVWEAEVGRGDASPVVAGERIFVFSRIDDRETVSALSRADASLLWRRAYDAPFRPLSIVGEHAAGPYSTPVVAGDRLFTLGITEILTAWDTASGETRWQKQFTGEFKRTQPFYGASQSPIVADGLLVVHLGGPGDGALVAFDPESGAERWRVAGDGPAYGSPIVVEQGGVRLLVTLTQRQLIGVELATGRVLFREPFQLNFDVTALTPLAHQGLLILSGNETPVRGYRIERAGDAWSLVQSWTNADVAMQFSSPVIAGGKLLAFSHRNKGQLVALDPATGAQLWTGPPRSGDNAWLLATGDWVLAVYDGGEVEVFEVKGEIRPVASYTLTDSPVWAHPALLQRHLLIKEQTRLRLWEIADG